MLLSAELQTVSPIPPSRGTSLNTGAPWHPVSASIRVMEITSPADWDAAQEQLGWFHDAVTLSLVFVNDERVLPDSSMQMSQGEAQLRAIIQTQSRERPGAQLTFRGVHSFKYESDLDVQPGEVVVEPTENGELLRFAFAECEVLARSVSLVPMDWQAAEAAIRET